MSDQRVTTRNICVNCTYSAECVSKSLSVERCGYWRKESGCVAMLRKFHEQDSGAEGVDAERLRAAVTPSASRLPPGLYQYETPDGTVWSHARGAE